MIFLSIQHIAVRIFRESGNKTEGERGSACRFLVTEPILLYDWNSRQLVLGYYWLKVLHQVNVKIYIVSEIILHKEIIQYMYNTIQYRLYCTIQIIQYNTCNAAIYARDIYFFLHLSYKKRHTKSVPKEKWLDWIVYILMPDIKNNVNLTKK